MKHNKIINTIHTLAIAAGLFGFVIFGMQAKPNQKPTSNETVLILELIKQMQTQMAENQKQTNQQIAELKAQMAENQKQTNQQMAELKAELKAEMKEIKAEQKELRAEMKELRAEMQTITQKVDRIGFYFDMLQYVFLTIVGSAVIYILALFREQIKNFIINLFTSSKKINVMNIKTITNQSTLTIIIIAIMLLISLGNAQAQTYRDRDSDGLIDILYIEQLDSMRYNLTGACEGSICNGYELKRSLDFRDSLSYRNYRSYISSTHDSSFYAREEGWRPVGSATYVNGTLQEGNPFNTLFEGNGNTIDHLYIQRSTNSYVGLFGYTGNNSIVRNIGIRNVSVTGNDFVGGLVGRNNGGTISQSYATGSVSGHRVGGLVGWNNGTIIQSYATGAVTGAYSAGGLVGVNSYGGTISQSYATGAVSGIVETGGLAGRNHGTISQSYATGAVSGDVYVGGLVGYNYNGTINQSYATGAVSGSGIVGGLMSGNYNGTVHHGYWNVDAPQTVNGTVRSTHNKVGIDYRVGTVIETHIRSLTLSALESPTGTAADTIQELGPGFIYKQGFLPYIHRGARLTVHSIHFTQTIPSWTNIDTNSIVANVIQGTDTTRATLTVDGIPFTANIIGTTNITSPYTLRNIQNGTGEGIVGKYGTKIHFAALGMKTYGDAPFVLSATSSAHLPLFFSASNTIVSISNNTVIIHGGGTVNITAYSLETDTIGFTSVTQILTIHKVFQSIEFGVLASKTLGDAPFVLSASSSAHLPVLFSTSNTLVRILNNVVIINGGGTVSITAYSLENDTIGFTSATQILTIHKVFQSIEFGVLASKTFGDAPFVLSARSSAHLPVFFSASNTLVRILNNVVIINGGGTVNITAYSLENDTVVFASATQILTIQKKSQSISFPPLVNRSIEDASFVLRATSSASLPVAFSSSNTIVSVYYNVVRMNEAGTVSITAYNNGNNNYLGSSVTQTLRIVGANDTTKSNPNLTFTAIPNLSIGQKYVMTATSNSPVTIIFTSSDTNKVSIRGNTATAKAIGNVVITASQEANATYNPATAQQTVTVVATSTPSIHPLTPIEKGNSAIRIYPNPANDYITIQADKSQKVSSVKIYDMTGKSYELGIRNYELGLRVDLKTLSKGEYIIILYGEKGEVWKAEKVIKE